MSSETVQRLIAAVLKLGEEQGMDAQDLAARAGVRPETLSRAKTRGTADVDTLAKLASAVGKKIDLVASEPLIEKLRSKSLLDP